MTIKRFQISGKNYLCTTIDIDTLCQKAQMLMKTDRTPVREIAFALSSLRQRCLSVESDSSVVRQSFALCRL